MVHHCRNIPKPYMFCAMLCNVKKLFPFVYSKIVYMATNSLVDISIEKNSFVIVLHKTLR